MISHLPEDILKVEALCNKHGIKMTREIQHWVLGHAYHEADFDCEEIDTYKQFTDALRSTLNKHNFTGNIDDVEINLTYAADGYVEAAWRRIVTDEYIADSWQRYLQYLEQQKESAAKRERDLKESKFYHLDREFNATITAMEAFEKEERRKEWESLKKELGK